MVGDLNTAHTSTHDIVLIKTTKRVQLQHNVVETIGLVAEDIIQPGHECYAFGWGETYDGSGMCIYI